MFDKFSQNFSQFGGVISFLLVLLVGVFLRELTTYFQIKREHTKAIGMLVAELLELRHSLIGLTLVTNVLADRFSIPEDLKLVVKRQIGTLLPQSRDWASKYDQAVMHIAGTDPVLAFTLRSKNRFHEMLRPLDTLASQAPNELIGFMKLEGELESIILPSLEETIVLLARKHGFITWLRVRAILKNGPELPNEIKGLIDKFSKEYVLPKSN